MMREEILNEVEYLISKLTNPAFDEMDYEDRVYIISRLRYLFVLEQRYCINNNYPQGE